MKLAIVAGEASGDLLGADLVRAMRGELGTELVLVGVGGPALQSEGLTSLFDFSELSIMGVTAVVARLPKLLARIAQTVKAIVEAQPDALIIIDSPDFTHRVAKRVRKLRPELKVVNYVGPSVWAWKEYRAAAMNPYIDLVLSILPFEAEVMRSLGGPRTEFIGHRLAALPELLKARDINKAREPNSEQAKTVLLLPGSRSAEVNGLLPVMIDTAELLSARGNYRFILPAAQRQESRVKALLNGNRQIELVRGEEAKWKAFTQADAAIAASGTVLLELALAGIPTVSVYKTDWMIRMMLKRITIWSAALPNIIADYQFVPEYFNELIRPGSLARWAERLSHNTPERAASLAGCNTVIARMKTAEPAGQAAARHIMELLGRRG